MTERTAIVTGSTDGLGRRVATRLATEHGFRVVVHGRDHARGKAVVDAIAQGGGTATFVAADLASFAAVRKFAADLDMACPRIDLLVNNAGIGSGGTSGKRQESRDGHEVRFYTTEHYSEPPGDGVARVEDPRETAEAAERALRDGHR